MLRMTVTPVGAEQKRVFPSFSYDGIRFAILSEGKIGFGIVRPIPLSLVRRLNPWQLQRSAKDQRPPKRPSLEHQT
jgi:hypothetical protein